MIPKGNFGIFNNGRDFWEDVFSFIEKKYFIIEMFLIHLGILLQKYIWDSQILINGKEGM